MYYGGITVGITPYMYDVPMYIYVPKEKRRLSLSSRLLTSSSQKMKRRERRVSKENTHTHVRTQPRWTHRGGTEAKKREKRELSKDEVMRLGVTPSLSQESCSPRLALELRATAIRRGDGAKHPLSPLSRRRDFQTCHKLVTACFLW